MGYSSGGHEELDMTEHAHTYICISVAGDLWGQEKINVKACVDDYKNNF